MAAVMSMQWRRQSRDCNGFVLATVVTNLNPKNSSRLQHWLWKFLKDETRIFAPLRRMFAKIKVDTPKCGTAAWTEIFLLYPVAGAAIAHKLLARGLKTCLGFKDNSTAPSTDYIAVINASVLPHEARDSPDVYALVTVMGIYLSDSSGHQKAYKELLAHVNDGHALTLETVQHAIIKFSRSRSARAFALTRRRRLSGMHPQLPSLLRHP
jgi:hypothetical protein